jgi:acyl dehydratase
MEIFTGIDDIKASLGRELGPTDWLTVDQARIDGFADITEDHQWIHVDTERAAEGPYGATVAHGFLTLSLVPYFVNQLRRIENVRHGVNYGLERVRFPWAVRAGSRIRARSVLHELTKVGADGVQLVMRTTVEAEGGEKPVCVADLVSRYTFGLPGDGARPGS